MRDLYIKTYGAGGGWGEGCGGGGGRGGGSGGRLHVGNKRCEVLLITSMRGSGTATKSLQADGTVQGGVTLQHTVSKSAVFCLFLFLFLRHGDRVSCNG